jgi:hypothetical protein
MGWPYMEEEDQVRDGLAIHGGDEERERQVLFLNPQGKRRKGELRNT